MRWGVEVFSKMRRWLGFPLAEALVFVVLALISVHVAKRALEQWTDKDLRTRAAMAVGEGVPLRQMLSDDQIIAAAACSPDETLLAFDGRIPEGFTCQTGLAAGFWFSGAHRLHTMPVPVEGGHVVVVQNADWLAGRERRLAGLLWLLFGVGWLLTVGFTALSSWSAARRTWAELRGERDELVLEGEWTPQRLKQLVDTQLKGTQVTVVSNREPYIHSHDGGPDGPIVVSHPASGLVTALEPVMRATGGLWVAHGSGNADHEASDPKGRLRVPPGDESYLLKRVWLTQEEEAGYYYGFSNEGLWPLCHLVHTRPDFRAPDFAAYREANERFAVAVAQEVRAKDPIVLVQDYHFAMLPRMITDRLPRATVVSFWHIPWPSAERFGICPWREELLKGMLGSAIVGFHTQQHCNNFLETCDRFLECRIDREQNAVVRLGHTTLVRPYPISVEWPNRWAQTAPPVEQCRREVRADLGLPPDTLLGVAVDRLDYTKGFEERVQAVERLLERAPQLIGRFCFVQLAAPSRTAIPMYQELNAKVEAAVLRVNSRFPKARVPPVKLLRAHHEPPAVFKTYRAADLCYVSSLHDGMNLVAKEFVAARDDEQGVLVLSSFTGASRELTEALVVNPYDLDEAAEAMRRALEMRRSEQRDRMRAMRAQVKEYNVYRWAGRMLIDVVWQRRHARFAPLRLVSQAA
jgi:trehalose 6-phosphate synthase